MRLLRLIRMTIAKAIWAFLRLFFRYEITGLENIPPDGPVTFAVNHRSLLDAPIVWMALRQDVRFVATNGVFYVPFLWPFLLLLRCIPIKRRKKRRPGMHKGTFSAIERACKKGHRLVFFPEGGIRGGRPISIKGGIVKIANFGCPIVPVTMEGVPGSLFGKRLVKITVYPPHFGEKDLRPKLTLLFETV